MARSLPIALFSSIITALLGAQEARAYPALIEAKAFPLLGNASREALIAIAPGKGGAYRRIPVQFDEVGDRPAPLVAFPQDLKKIEFPDVKSKFGLFYHVTSLARGFHNLNVWFYTGSKDQEAMLG